MGIEVRNVSKRFGAFDALKNIDLSVPDGELLALLGPSGSGKTTLLRMIAGLDFPDTGSVHLNGEDASATNASERRVGFVFQHYALFRHMTVFENVAFGLRVRPRKLRPSRQKFGACHFPPQPRTAGLARGKISGPAFRRTTPADRSGAGAGG